MRVDDVEQEVVDERTSVEVPHESGLVAEAVDGLPKEEAVGQ